MSLTQTCVAVQETGAEVSALLQQPAQPLALLVLGHGAGAGMQHPFMQSVATLLAERGIATLRYQFPYIERGRRSPDSRNVLLATVRAALATARATHPELPLLVGGKSMGGRMASLALAERPEPDVVGVVFLGFPLHNADKRGNERADHLLDVPQPMLFVQGSRDKLADLSYLQPVCARLGARATLHVVEGGDHSFAMLKRDARTQAEALSELADVVHGWVAHVVA